MVSTMCTDTKPAAMVSNHDGDVGRTLLGMAEAREPLLRQTLEAIRAHNEAQSQSR